MNKHQELETSSNRSELSKKFKAENKREYGRRTIRKKNESHPSKKKKTNEHEMSRSESLLSLSVKDLSFGQSSSDNSSLSVDSDCLLVQEDVVGTSSKCSITNSVLSDQGILEIDTGHTENTNNQDESDVRTDTPQIMSENTKKQWGDDIVFKSQKEVDKFAEDEGFLRLSGNRSSNGDETIYYRCKHLPKRLAKSCKAMKVFKSSRNMEFIVSVSIGEHTHTTVTQSRGHTKKPELLEYVYDLKSKDGLKPRKIKEHLLRNRPEEPAPNIRQIRYMIKTVEEKKIPSTISYGEMIEWLKTQTAVPVTIDTAFVLDWFYEEKDDSFAFVVTTRRLLRNAIREKNLSGDGTYKIIWQRFPIIVIGMIDREKHFHVIAIVVTSNERTSEYEFVFQTIRMGVERETKQMYKPNTVISDHAAAIRNGFFAAFGPSDNVICSVHMFRKLRERSGYSSKENKQAIIDDIHVLHNSPDRETFEAAVPLFLEKWEEKDKDFCTYFKLTWLGEHTRNWYRGYSPFVPDNNNAIEGTNLSIKRDFTLRELIPFNTFKITVIDMVTQMSLRYNSQSEDIPKQVALVPKLTNKLYRAAYTWIANNPSVLPITRDHESIGYLVAKEAMEMEPMAMLAIKNKKHHTFDELKEVNGKIYTIQFCNDKRRWSIESVCSCLQFQRNFICKHLLGFAFHHKLKRCPEEGNNKLIPKKSKKGRIALAKKALQKQ